MNSNTLIISALVAIISLVGSITYYKESELQAIKSNIESAIVKGIDPIAVRCAYANEKDVVCAVYASSERHPQPPVSTTKK